MGLLDSIKNIMSIPDEDEFEDEFEEEEAEREQEPKKKAKADSYSSPKKSEPSPRILGGGKNAKTVSFNQSQMQVVLVKPDRFEDVSSIADHLNEKKTVVLNLEAANREVSRRIIDFLSGVAYANKGNIKKVANSTFIIVPFDVDVMGELMLDDIDENKIYF